MLYFSNDYSEGAHPEILRRLLETNLEHTPGYGRDIHCANAKKIIQNEIGKPDAGVYFISGGTQTNRLVISSMLKPYQGVVAAESGHVASHEAGSIENSGHKVLTLPGRDGKIPADALESFAADFYRDGNYEHMVFPGMVYISQPTEYGTLYTKSELSALSSVCREFGMYLYMDGARLGYALACPENDLSLKDIAELTDVFFIGGTKVGALFGEAVVFQGGSEPEHFFTIIKQQGALLAKGRILGIQFETLFSGGLYRKIGKRAIDTASKIKKALLRKGYRLYTDSPTNQLFIIMENERLRKLEEQVAVSFMNKYDDSSTVIRICTSWATSHEDADRLCELL